MILRLFFQLETLPKLKLDLLLEISHKKGLRFKV